MIEDRILITLTFFDAQDMALTLLELHEFLLSSAEQLAAVSKTPYEFAQINYATQAQPVSLAMIAAAVDMLVSRAEVALLNGYYTLKGRSELVGKRLDHYRFGIIRERRIRHFLDAARHLPFIRGIAIGGSQALGLPNEKSDIDLLVITDPRFIWMGRTFITFYFQVFGVRRHGNIIANRFCLNHYIGGIKYLERDRNLYTALEYSRLRAVVNKNTIEDFHQVNARWLEQAFPELSHYQKLRTPLDTVSVFQRILETVIMATIGKWLESKLATWQQGRIKAGEYIFVEADELSFHHQGKQKHLLTKFYSFLSRFQGPKLMVNVINEELILEISEH